MQSHLPRQAAANAEEGFFSTSQGQRKLKAQRQIITRTARRQLLHGRNKQLGYLIVGLNHIRERHLSFIRKNTGQVFTTSCDMGLPFRPAISHAGASQEDVSPQPILTWVPLYPSGIMSISDVVAPEPPGIDFNSLNV